MGEEDTNSGENRNPTGKLLVNNDPWGGGPSVTDQTVKGVQVSQRETHAGRET